MEDNVLYLKSASLNVKSYPKTLTEGIQTNVWLWALWPSQVDMKLTITPL